MEISDDQENKKEGPKDEYTQPGRNDTSTPQTLDKDIYIDKKDLYNTTEPIWEKGKNIPRQYPTPEELGYKHNADISPTPSIVIEGQNDAYTKDIVLPSSSVYKPLQTLGKREKMEQAMLAYQPIKEFIEEGIPLSDLNLHEIAGIYELLFLHHHHLHYYYEALDMLDDPEVKERLSKLLAMHEILDALKDPKYKIFPQDQLALEIRTKIKDRYRRPHPEIITQDKEGNLYLILNNIKATENDPRKFNNLPTNY